MTLMGDIEHLGDVELCGCPKGIHTEGQCKCGRELCPNEKGIMLCSLCRCYSMVCACPGSPLYPGRYTGKELFPELPWGECGIACPHCGSSETDIRPLERNTSALLCGDCGHRERLTGV